MYQKQADSYAEQIPECKNETNEACFKYFCSKLTAY